jgi:gas vesicle protein
MGDELQEIHEHVHEAEHDPSLAPVTITMAILAVLVAAVSLLGHRAHTEELLLQNKSTSQWAYYQAKNIRRHTYELFLDLLSVSDPKNSELAEKIKQKYSKVIERYDGEQKDIEAEAKKLEDEVSHEQRRADRFDIGEVCLECALVICSITLLTKKRLYWGFGLVLGVAGVSLALTGLWVG